MHGSNFQNFEKERIIVERPSAQGVQSNISHLSFDIISPLTGGCSEGIDAFSFFFNIQ